MASYLISHTSGSEWFRADLSGSLPVREGAKKWQAMVIKSAKGFWRSVLCFHGWELSLKLFPSVPEFFTSKSLLFLPPFLPFQLSLVFLYAFPTPFCFDKMTKNIYMLILSAPFL